MKYFTRTEKYQKYVNGVPTDEFKEGNSIGVFQFGTMNECETYSEWTSNNDTVLNPSSEGFTENKIGQGIDNDYYYFTIDGAGTLLKLVPTVVKSSHVDLTNVTDLSNLFSVYDNLDNEFYQGGDFSRWNTSNVTTMNGMFDSCVLLEDIDLSNSNMTKCNSMQQMFNGCTRLKSVRMGYTEGEEIAEKDFRKCFYNCGVLTTIDFSGFANTKVSQCSEMFSGCVILETIDLSNLDMSHSTDVSNMFKNCSLIKEIDFGVNNFNDTAKFDGMFSGCSSLTSLDLGSFTSQNIMTISNMFNGCTNLESVNISNVNTSNATNFDGMFKGCNNLRSLNINHFDVSGMIDARNMFQECTSITSLDLSSWNPTKLVYADSMFHNCSALREIDLSGWVSSQNINSYTDMFTGCANLKRIYVSATGNVKDYIRNALLNSGLTDQVTIIEK